MIGQYFQTAVRKPSGSALEEFMLLNGRYSNFTKETFFIRYISGPGWDQDLERLQAWQKQGRQISGPVPRRQRPLPLPL